MNLQTREERKASVKLASARNSLGLSNSSHSEFYLHLLQRYIDGEVTLEEKGEMLEAYYMKSSKS